MFFWMQFPFVRIALFFISGILAAQHLNLSLKEATVLFVVSGLSFFIVKFFVKKEKYYNRVITGFAFLFTVFCFGLIYFLFYRNLYNPDSQLYQEPQYYVALISDDVERKGKNYRTVVEVLKIKRENIWIKSSGKVLLYFPTGKDNIDIDFGDLILVKGSPSVVSGPGNPEEFDYRSYLENQNIYFQHFTKTKNLKLIKKGAVKNLIFYVKILRRKAVAVINKYIDGNREKGIALALVLGVKNELDPEIKHAYASSGAMHVLAVSGLHVGMIYLVILKLFRRVKEIRGGRFLFALFSLSSLWLYALITGLSASVFRAVTMFSVIILSDAYNKQTNIYNSVALAAVILLIYNPLFLFNVGFQLSFVAVIGIIYIFQKLYYLVYPDNKFVDYVWSLCCIALAAQVATFPLGLYYFHQFPVYFFVSNLVVIPAAFGILSVGLCLLVFHFIPGVGEVLGYLLENFIWLVNEAIFKLEFLPYYLIEQVYLSSFQTILLYSFIFFFAMFLHIKKIVPLAGACISVFLFSCISMKQLYFQKHQNEIVFYNINNNTIIDFIEGSHFATYSDSSKTIDMSKIKYHIENYRLKKGLKSKELNSSNLMKIPTGVAFKKVKNVDFIVWKGNKIIIVNEPLEDNEVIISKINARFLVIRNNSHIELSNILKRFNFQKLIIDGSNNFIVASKLEDEAGALNLNYHSTRKDGALVVDLTRSN